MIELAHVTKKYDGKAVVQDLTLHIAKGEVVGFLGPNGAGKTTTVRMIAGVLPPSNGTVLINEQNLFSEDLTTRPHIGYLPENNPIYDDMTVEEFLKMWAELKAIPKPDHAALIEEAVVSTGLEEVYYRPIAELSKGYKQRTGLAQAIVSKPQILLLDEPTEGLDPNQRRDIHKLLTNIGKERTVIICSHVLSEITKMCNRILIINHGQLVADSPTSELGNLSGGNVMYEVVASGKEVERDIDKLKGVKAVRSIKEDGAVRYTITARTKDDLRLPIFELAKTKNWKLYELVRKQQDLEDIFAKLTQE